MSPLRRQRARLTPARRTPVGAQLLLGLVATVAIPWLLRTLIYGSEEFGLSQQYALLGTALAFLLGGYLFQSFMNFPGVQSGFYVAPSFMSSYGLVLAIFFLARLDYSRFQFTMSFIAAILWYFGVILVMRRARLPVFAILPAGQAPALAAIPGIDWRRFDPEASRPRMAFDGVVADLRADMPEAWERFLADCALSGIPVYHCKYIEESLTGAVQIEHLSENNFGSLIPGLAWLRIKQVFDIAAAAVAGVLILPLVALIALAVRLESPGPALFRQRRTGYRGAPFTVLKFRTMRHEPASAATVPDDEIERAITRVNDRRITRLGAVLRKYRLDELPQIYNIVRGEMSWIGPRPEALPLSRWYESELPFYRYRHIVRPGISGWAQVNQGHVHNVEEVLGKLHFDFYYIKYFSPSLDLLILVRTIRTMLTGFGAR